MRYLLAEQYFKTSIFQNTVIEYFDTVFGAVLARHNLTMAKGWFAPNGELKRDHYDMAYPIHILNGLIPALFVFERYAIAAELDAQPERLEHYLKVFVLGYTFHDANKLFSAPEGVIGWDLLGAVDVLRENIDAYKIRDFFPEFDSLQEDVYYLICRTENRSAATGNLFTPSLSSKFMNEVLERFSHFADGVASISHDLVKDKERINPFSTVELFHEAVVRCLETLSDVRNLPVMSVSFVKIRQNPYTLLSQNLIWKAKKVLTANDKKVLFTLRDGFVFWGEDITDEELGDIRASSKDLSNLIKPEELTKVDAQKCTFDFVGKVAFTKDNLKNIIHEKQDNFLALSPNGKDKIKNFAGFQQFLGAFFRAFHIRVEPKEKDGKLYLFWVKELEDDSSDALFRYLYCLRKVTWLNAKNHKKWQIEFDSWIPSDKKISKTGEKSPVLERKLAKIVEFTQAGKLVVLNTVSELNDYIESNTDSSNALLKTFLNFIYTWEIVYGQDVEEREEYLRTLETEVIQVFSASVKTDSNVLNDFFDRYFTCRGVSSMQFLDAYNPVIPDKGSMCAFTGGKATLEYTEGVAFGMGARGFSNRTITTLKNTSSYISELFSVENALRKSDKSFPDNANIVVYNDFFESQLDISHDVFKVWAKAKPNLKFTGDNEIKFDKAAHYRFNLYNLEFVSLKPDIESIFYFVRRQLILVREMGVRSFVSGLMSPYTSHREIFHYENAPRWLQMLGWDKVRIHQVEEVLEEIKLVLVLGNSRLKGNILNIAEKRSAYFTIYYLLDRDDQKKVYEHLNIFISAHPQLFKNMTITENLAQLAANIKLGYESGSEETWLIRTTTRYLRNYAKKEHSREDIIQKMCGELYRALRQDNPNQNAIEAFATAVYDDLFVQDWKGIIPAMNIEKDWIYQFAFLYRRISLERITQMKARKFRQTLLDQGKEINEDNALELLKKEKLEKHKDKYLPLILAD